MCIFFLSQKYLYIPIGDDDGGGGALTAFNKAFRQCEQTDGLRAPARLQVTTMVVVVAVVRD